MTPTFRARVKRFASRLCGTDSVLLDMRRLHGGIAARGVFLIRARPTRGARRPVSFVAKLACGDACREAMVYRHLQTGEAAALAPKLLGVDRGGDDEVALYLEPVRAACRWPWHDPNAALAVVTTLARLHAAMDRVLPWSDGWDYERALEASARGALTLLEGAPQRALPRRILETRRALRSLVLRLPELRRDLATFGPPGRHLLHGDVHSGNVLVTRSTAAPVVFIDWARARTASALEDISSWLLSLGLWVRGVRRHHDTLLRAYLDARELPSALTASLRSAYWFAAASNVLAGAFAHHLRLALQSAADHRPESEMSRAWMPVHGWARVLRRAAAEAT